MRKGLEIPVIEIDDGDIPPLLPARARWTDLVNGAMDLQPGRGWLLGCSPYGDVHAIRNQIKRRGLPLAICVRKGAVYLSRLPGTRRAA